MTEDSSSSRPRSRLVLKTCLAIALISLLGLGGYIYRGHRDLAKLRAHLIVQGEILDWRKLGTNAAPHQINGMPDLIAAANDMPELPSGLPTRFSPRPGYIVDITRIENLPADLHVTRGSKRNRRWISNVWTEIGPAIDASRTVWDRAVNATTNEVLMHQVDWIIGMASTHIPDTSLRPLWKWSSQSAALHLQRGEVNQALMVTTNALRILESTQGVPTTLGELVRRTALGSGAPIWWLLQRDLNEEQLAGLKDALSWITTTRSQLRAIEVDRAQVIQAWEQMLTDSSKANTLIGPVNAIGLHLWRLAPSHHDLGWYLQTVQSEIEGVREAIARQSFQYLMHRMGGTNSPPGVYLLSKHCYWDQRVLHLHTYKAETRHEMQLAVIALNRFRLRHSQYPEKLEQLVPEFCDRVPVDWMNGWPLRYERTTNSFRLWSVGEDGIDQDGDPRPHNPKHSPWWLNGRDYLWPTAATPEETRRFAEDSLSRWKAATSTP